MENVFYYVMCSWGLTHLLVSGKIFENLRNWLQIRIPIIGELLNCYQCTSFWTSLFLYYIFNELPKISNTYQIGDFLSISFDPFVYSMIGCGIVPFISLIFSKLITKK